MKIKTTDGEIETNELPDIDAVALEKLEEFGAYFKNFGISFIIAYRLPRGNCGGLCHVTEDGLIFEALDSLVRKITNNQLEIVENEL